MARHFITLHLCPLWISILYCDFQVQRCHSANRPLCYGIRLQLWDNTPLRFCDRSYTMTTIKSTSYESQTSYNKLPIGVTVCCVEGGPNDMDQIKAWYGLFAMKVPLYPSQRRRNEFESGGHQSGAEHWKKFLVMPLHFFGSKSTIIRFGECLCDIQYRFWSVSCLLFLYSGCPPVPSHL